MLDDKLQAALDKLTRYSLNSAVGNLNAFRGKVGALENASPPRISHQDAGLLFADAGEASRCIESLGGRDVRDHRQGSGHGSK